MLQYRVSCSIDLRIALLVSIANNLFDLFPSLSIASRSGALLRSEIKSDTACVMVSIVALKQCETCQSGIRPFPLVARTASYPAFVVGLGGSSAMLSAGLFVPLLPTIVMSRSCSATLDVGCWLGGVQRFRLVVIGSLLERAHRGRQAG
jgi:hypothetical protein